MLGQLMFVFGVLVFFFFLIDLVPGYRTAGTALAVVWEICKYSSSSALLLFDIVRFITNRKKQAMIDRKSVV